MNNNNNNDNASSEEIKTKNDKPKMNNTETFLHQILTKIIFLKLFFSTLL